LTFELFPLEALRLGLELNFVSPTPDPSPALD
jgi:hypothetical protein